MNKVRPLLKNMINNLSRARKTTKTKVKGRFKSNFQTRNKTRLCDSDKNTGTKNKNMKCEHKSLLY
jgi:hypothetical protein